jgi:nitroreductase
VGPISFVQGTVALYSFCGTRTEKVYPGRTPNLYLARTRSIGEKAEQDYCENAAAHLIVVVKEESRPKEAEEALLASAALIQNFQLLAWGQGIGVVWKTNEYNWDQRFRRTIGVQPGEKVVGTLHMGYYTDNNIPKPRPRKRAEQLITWHKVQ